MKGRALALLVTLAVMLSAARGERNGSDFSTPQTTTVRSISAGAADISVAATRFDYSRSNDKRSPDLISGIAIGNPILQISETRHIALRPVFGGINGIQLSMSF